METAAANLIVNLMLWLAALMPAPAPEKPVEPQTPAAVMSEYFEW